MSTQLPSFDVLMDLARHHPDQLEAIRENLSEEIINKAPPETRHRLEGLNFKIRMERQRCKNPLQSCIRLTRLMHDSFERMRLGLDDLVHTPDNELLRPVRNNLSAPLADFPAENRAEVVHLAAYRHHTSCGKR